MAGRFTGTDVLNSSVNIFVGLTFFFEPPSFGCFEFLLQPGISVISDLSLAKGISVVYWRQNCFCCLMFLYVRGFCSLLSFVLMLYTSALPVQIGYCVFKQLKNKGEDKIFRLQIN